MSLILLYGEHGVDFEMVAQLFNDNLSYTIINLYELSSQDFEDGKLLEKSK
jgi:hypothetical protein